MMNQEDIFKKVGQILNELQDQYEFLARNPSQLNELELELFLANANFLSDHVQIVRKINSSKPQKVIAEHSAEQAAVAEEQPVVLVKAVQEPVPQPASTPEVIKMPEPVNEPEMLKEKTLEELENEYAANELEQTAAQPAEKIEDDYREPLKFEFLLNEDPENDKFEFEEKPIEAIFDRPLSKEESDIIAQKQQQRDQQQLTQTVEENITPAPVLERVEDKVSTAAEPTQAKPTLNELLAGKSHFSTSLNEENHKTPITDLKQAINLNEKLLYIKDLFNGYNLAYAEAIELLNKMPDFKTADNFLRNNYADKNNWAAKQSTVDKFYDLLNQRFTTK